MEIPRRTRWCLLLSSAVCGLAAAEPVAAQTPTEGWKGTISVKGSYDVIGQFGDRAGDGSAVYQLDGYPLGQPEPPPDPTHRQWSQDATWKAQTSEIGHGLEQGGSCQRTDSFEARGSAPPTTVVSIAIGDQGGPGVPPQAEASIGAGAGISGPHQIIVFGGGDCDSTTVEDRLVGACGAEIGTSSAPLFVDEDGTSETKLQGSRAIPHFLCGSAIGDDFSGTVTWSLYRGPDPPPECSDGVDNDVPKDGLIDYAGGDPKYSDPGCDNADDDSEADNLAVCSDGADNDNDGHTDFADDPGCDGPLDEVEADSQCQDGHDNDGDGRNNYPADPGCASFEDDSEAPDPACGDQVSNDIDGLVDLADPGCTDERDTSEYDEVNFTLEVVGPGTVGACEGTCFSKVERGSMLTLAGTPNSAASQLLRWEGDCAGRQPTCQLLMSQDRSVKARFGGAAFSWSMAERYNGSDRNGDKLADYFSPLNYTEFRPWPYDANVIAPSVWWVDLKASSGCAGHSVQWLVDGQPNGSQCEHSVVLSEGPHDVTLVLDGTPVASQIVTPKDWLIAAIGDSYGSGEGNPDVPKVERKLRRDVPSRWESKQCHRTAFAAAPLAAARVEKADEHSSVTLVHLSCSGATIDSGLVGSYAGAGPDDRPTHPTPPQVKKLRSLIGTRIPDALLISIGGNDIGFSSIITACLVYPACDENKKPRCVPRSILPKILQGLGAHRCGKSGAQIFKATLPVLASRYARLAAAVTAAGIPADRVIVTGYPDVTRGADGNFCGKSGNRTILGDALPQVLKQIHALRLLAVVKQVQRDGWLKIDGAEAKWAATKVLARLNKELKTIATSHGWSYVGAHVTAARLHGYCAGSARWVRTWTDAKKLQEALGHGVAQSPGAVHPNKPGQVNYMKAILPYLAARGLPTG